MGRHFQKGRGPAELRRFKVDTRGNIYICDDKRAVFILRYTGKGQPEHTAR